MLTIIRHFADAAQIDARNRRAGVKMLCRSRYRTESGTRVFALAATFCMTTATSQVTVSLPEPSISLRHPVPAQSPVTYAIDIKIPESNGDAKLALIHVICWPQEVDCKPTSGQVSLGPASSTSVVVDIPANINSVEIDAQLDAPGRAPQPAKSRFLDLGLSTSIHSIRHDIAADGISAGETVPIGFWFASKDGSALRPDSKIHVVISPRDHCVETKTVDHGGDPDAASFSSGPFKAVIDSQNPHMTSDFYVRAPFWAVGKCLMDVLLYAGDDEFDRPESIAIDVKPHLAVIALLCVSGSLLQLLLAGLRRLAMTTGSGSVKSDIFAAFIGPKYRLLSEALAKGLGALVLALCLEHAKIVNFGSVDGSSRLGYILLGFLVGFWSLHKLFATLKSLAHGGGADGSTPPAGHVEPKEGFRS
jgi:hypothetical protein